MTLARAGQIVDRVVEWGRKRTGISGIALVGSFAREAAGPSSDIDLVLLSTEPASFRTDTTWMKEIDWNALFTSVATWEDADYSSVWSRHVHLRDGEEIEFTFAPLSWALVEPIDPDTRQIVLRGFKLLYDPAAIFQKLFDACRRDGK
jgi:uncharacterized protein